MNVKVDGKQSRIINSWLQRSQVDNLDRYGAFISLWISFNAFCYSQYSGKANKRRADLKNDKGLKGITTGPSIAEGTVTFSANRHRLEIQKPGRIVIVISERYTEDIIFSEFARDYQVKYQNLLTDSAYLAQVRAYQDSLQKMDRAYVINMSQIRQYDAKGNIGDMIQKNVIVPLDNYDDLKQIKNTLYQVRCNVFHGEKIPGDINDDRIVAAAFPVLLGLMRAVVEEIASE